MGDLAAALRDFCRSAGQGNKVVAIHLFGIRNAAALNGRDLHDLADRAGIGRSFGTELRKGVRLADYVEVIRLPK
jgi:hypothetical protein